MCVCGQPAAHDPRAAEFLVECHYCANWYHGRCIHVNEVDAMEIVRFACPPCTKQGHSTLKYQDTAPMVDMDDITYAPLPIQRHRFDSPYSSASYNNFASNYKKNTEPFRRALRAAVFARSGVRMLSPQEFGPSYFKYHGFDEPLLVIDSNWTVAGLPRPLPIVGLQDVSALLANTASTVRGVDVGSQESFKLSATGWTARLAHPAPDAPLTAQFRVLETAFRHEVAAPVAVASIDWHFLLPSASGAPNRDTNPELYATLCGAGAFFDFTVSPDCKAAWLAVSNGDIDVFLIEPSASNIEAFREWKSDPKVPFSSIFLADRVDRCTKCSVKSGATLAVPSGWLYAIYSEHGGSFFTGYFSNTLNLATHLDVWQRLEGGAGDARFARHWQETSFPHGWNLQHPSPAVAPPPPLNAQVWALVCHYINEFSHIDALLRVTSQDREAIRQALPVLRQWGNTARSVERLDNVSWLPATLHEAGSLLDQLEQSLLTHPASAAVSSVSNTNIPSMATGDSSYLYSSSADEDIWNAGGVSGAFATTTGAYHQESVTTTTSNGMWDYSSYNQGGPTGSIDPLTGSNVASQSSTPYYHQQHIPDANQFSTALHASPYGNTAQGYGAGAGYLDPTASPGGLGGLVGGAGHPFMDVANGLGGLHDVHVRHRASCHRCGNLRKKNVRCPKCPHIFCQKCAEKMVEEHGDSVFADGCPVCKELCCCGKNRTMMCTRKFHCYKKCPATKRPTT